VVDEFGEGLIEVTALAMFVFVWLFEGWRKDQLFKEVRQLSCDVITLEVSGVSEGAVSG
jgi:hypothetical protein